MKSSRTKKIGVFDSGFGGLDILRGIEGKLGDYEYIFLADSARAPYGNRSHDKILEFTTEAVDFLFEKGCELVILACNTASSDALHKIQSEYLPKKHPNKRVLGVLIPAVEEAVKVTKNKKIGVIATLATVKSEAFVDEFRKIDSKIKVYQNACPLLVPIVEYDEINNPATQIVLQNYLKPLLSKKIDTLVLGCTHYGLLEKKIKKIVGPNVKIISEARVVPSKLENYLKRHTDIEQKISLNAKITFYSTDMTQNFQKLGSRFFGRNISSEKVTKLV